MIAADQHCHVDWIPTDRIVIDDNEQRDLTRVAFYLGLLHNDTTHTASPGLVIVWPHPDQTRYIAIDGRHRFLAHILAGRTQVRCLIITNPGQDQDR